jgi:hypothetical protein
MVSVFFAGTVVSKGKRREGTRSIYVPEMFNTVPRIRERSLSFGSVIFNSVGSARNYYRSIKIKRIKGDQRPPHSGHLRAQGSMSIHYHNCPDVDVIIQAAAEDEETTAKVCSSQ